MSPDGGSAIRIDQVVVGATRHDAITNMALRIRDALREVADSDVYSANIIPGTEDVLELEHYSSGSEDNIIIFHGSYGDPKTFAFLLSRPEKMILAFHNLAPAETFETSDPERAAFLHWGWREIEILRDHFSAVVADSEFNRDELSARGYDAVEVIPAGIDPWRLTKVVPDHRVLDRACGGKEEFVILYSGQSLHHKRIEVLLHASLLLRFNNRPVRLVVVGAMTDPVVHESLVRTVLGLGLDFVSILGVVSDRELAALFERADVVATASIHEGLCLPVLEAMAMGVPVVARSAGALPSTCGSAAILLPEDAGPSEFARAIAEVMDDAELRSKFAVAGRRNVERFDPGRTMARFIDVVAGVV